MLQALAEWMQQALDFRDWDRQLRAAEACLDERARNAGPEERANIEQVRAQAMVNGHADAASGGGHGIAGSANLSTVELFACPVPR